jgi:hypothetical protein
VKIETLTNPTLATPINHPTKSTKKMERKPDGNANGNANAVSISTGTKPSKVEPAPPAPFADKTASSENFSASSNGNANAVSISTGIKPSEVKPAPLAPFMDNAASSEDIYFDASDEKA